MAYLSISWHLQSLPISLNISEYLSSTAAYDVIFCNAPAGPFRTNMLHCSNQVSNFVRRPLTTPKPWAHGLQVEVDLKNIEPVALLSALKMHAAAHCSPAAHWQWEERRRCSKFCWDRRGSPSLVPACSLTVRLWTTPQPRNVTDSHNLPWLATCPAKCWGVKWAGHMLVIGWSCSGIQQLEAPRCPKMSQDVSSFEPSRDKNVLCYTVLFCRLPAKKLLIAWEVQHVSICVHVYLWLAGGLREMTGDIEFPQTITNR